MRGVSGCTTDNVDLCADIGKITLESVLDHHLADHRNRILVVGETDMFGDRKGDLDDVLIPRSRGRHVELGSHGTIQRLVKYSFCLYRTSLGPTSSQSSPNASRITLNSASLI